MDASGSATQEEENPPESLTDQAWGELPDVVRLKAAIYRRLLPGAARYIKGGPLKRLRALVDDYGLGSVTDATEHVTAGVHKVPHFVDELAVVLAAGGPILTVDPTAELDRRQAQRAQADADAKAAAELAERRAWLDAEIAHLREAIAGADQRGATKRAGSLRSELAERETERDRLAGSDTA